MSTRVDLHLLPDRLAVCQLPASTPWPSPTSASGFWSVTRTQAELSVVCPEDAAPVGEDARIEAGWRALAVDGPLDFSMVGVMAGLAATLAGADISVFVLSTYDTDYVLVRSTAVDRAVDSLRSAGYAVDVG